MRGSRGLSLIETMIALGLFAGLALGVADMQSRQAKSLARTAKAGDAKGILQSVTNQLTSLTFNELFDYCSEKSAILNDKTKVDTLRRKDICLVAGKIAPTVVPTKFDQLYGLEMLVDKNRKAVADGAFCTQLSWCFMGGTGSALEIELETYYVYDQAQGFFGTQKKSFVRTRW